MTHTYTHTSVPPYTHTRTHTIDPLKGVSVPDSHRLHGQLIIRVHCRTVEVPRLLFSAQSTAYSNAKKRNPLNIEGNHNIG